MNPVFASSRVSWTRSWADTRPENKTDMEMTRIRERYFDMS